MLATRTPNEYTHTHGGEYRKDDRVVVGANCTSGMYICIVHIPYCGIPRRINIKTRSRRLTHTMVIPSRIGDGAVPSVYHHIIYYCSCRQYSILTG